MSGLSPEERSLLAGTWSFRAERELESELRFARLAGRLEATGALPAVIEAARRAVRDEARHATLCDELAARFGAGTPAAPPTRLPEIAPTAWSLRDRVLYEAVAFCCVCETLNTALLTEELRVVTDGPLRETTHAILRDEVQHARLGWAHLHGEAERRTLLPLGALLPRMLELSMSEELRDPPAKESAGLTAHGRLRQALRREIFRRTVDCVVLPGLARVGIDTAPARQWLSRTLPKPPPAPEV